jgi:drug/metabolite transporter (DMT)-like permease
MLSRAPAPAGGHPVVLMALFAGAFAIASAGIFVRWSETGPTATAFWRGALALPFLLPWMLLERQGLPMDARQAAAASSWDSRFFWCGFFFAADLFVWHWSLLETSVAASTLEANLAPIVVVFLMWALYGEKPSQGFVFATGLALAGIVMVVLPKLASASPALRGDLLGLATAVCYGAYLVAVARVRAERTTAELMFWSTLVMTVLLLPLALMQKFLPDTGDGWITLLALAFIAQALGQGLIAYSLAHLPAAFGSVGLYVQPIGAAVYACLLLGESLAPIQIVGGVVVIAGIALARASSQSTASRHSESRNLAEKKP